MLSRLLQAAQVPVEIASGHGSATARPAASTCRGPLDRPIAFLLFEMQGATTPEPPASASRASARWARRGGGLMLLAVALGMPHTLPGWETRRDLTVLVLAALGLASSLPWAWFWPQRVTSRVWRYSLGALCVAAWGAALFYGFAFALFLTMPVGILQNREYAATLTSTEVGATYDLHHWTNWDGDIRRSDLALRRGPFEFVVWEGDIGAAAIDVRRWGHRLEVRGRPGGQCEAWIDGTLARWDFAFARDGGERCSVATTEPPSE